MHTLGWGFGLASLGLIGQELGDYDVGIAKVYGWEIARFTLVVYVASATQLYSTWEDPPFPPQTLGQLLSTIADLGILRVHTHRSTRNRYDLTAYDQTRMDQLAVIVTEETESATGSPPSE